MMVLNNAKWLLAAAIGLYSRLILIPCIEIGLHFLPLFRKLLNELIAKLELLTS